MQKRARPKTSAASVVPSQQELTRPLTREVVRSPEFVSIYSNDVQVWTSPWDLRLILGELSDQPTPGTVIVNQLAELRMSPQLAKKLTMIMIQQLKAYEADFGEIPLRD